MTDVEIRADSPPQHPIKAVVHVNNFVRKHTLAVDVSTLNQKGITRLNTLTFSKINELIAQAASRAIEKYEAAARRSIDEEARGRIEGEVREAVRRNLRPEGTSPGAGPEGAPSDPIAALRAENDLLQARVEKLRHELAEAEAELQRARAASEADPGVASLFRSVQGIDARDPAREKKSGMLRDIFEENFVLQKAGRLQ